MELLKDLELVEVVIHEGKATLSFLNCEKGEIETINFNKKVYDDGKFVDNEEKAEKVEQWCQEYFNLSFDELGKAVGMKKDVYAYDNFSSLWEVEQIEKFDKDAVGQIFQAEIKNIEDDGKGIRIKFEYDGKIYESKMMYADYMEDMKKWIVNRLKKKKQLMKFEEKYHVPVDKCNDLIGKSVMVEVKKAFGKHIYAEIKPLPKPKKA